MRKAVFLLLTVLFLTACAEQQGDSGIAAELADEGKRNTESVEKETLVLGLYPTVFDYFRNAIFKFNQNHPLYQMEIKEYEDSSQLNVDIIARKAPDIILLPPYFMMNIYADKGVFADLYPLLDSDETIKRTDLQGNILEAYEINGQLFGMPVHYDVNTVAIARSHASEISSWTLDEMFEFADRQLPESKFFQNHTKSFMLYICLGANGDVMIDWDNGGIFNRDLFFKILDFSNRFTPDDSYVGKRHLFDQIPGNTVQLISRNLGSLSFLQVLQQELGGQVAFPGFPAEVGNGNIVHSAMLLAINKDCTNQEAAWSFISSLLTENFQINNSTISLPIRKSALELYLDKEREGSISITGTDIVFDFYPPTEDEKQQMRDLIASITKISSLDVRIEDILQEEAKTFFAGFKSAEEAADIAANRIEIYMSEFK